MSEFLHVKVEGRIKMMCPVLQLCPTLCNSIDCIPQSYGCIVNRNSLWTPLSMGFSRQEYWSGLLFLLQGIFLTRSSNPHPLYLLHWLGSQSYYQFSSVQSLSLCDPINHSMLGLPVHHKLPEFTQTHAHRVGDAIQSSHPLSSPSPPAPNPSQHQGLFQ